MKKSLAIVYLVLLLHSAVAQITVKGTNQFFTGKTPSGGNVLVFLYSEEAAFVWGQGRSYQKITVKFSTQDYKEIFIAGNILGCYMRSSFYAYDLKSLLQEQNDNKTLSDTRSRINIIDNISSMIVNNENILYIQNNQLYQYRADQNTSVPVKGVNISSKNDERMYLVYNPVLDDQKTEYGSINAKMNALVDDYNQIPNKAKLVESIRNASNRTLDGLYSMVKDNLLREYGFNVDTCKRYFMFAAIMNKTTEADTVINRLKKVLVPPNAALQEYFRAIDNYARLTAPTELPGRMAKIEEGYRSSIRNVETTFSTEKDAAERRYLLAKKTADDNLSQWGSSIGSIKSKITALPERERSLNSILFIKDDYEKNRDTIEKFNASFFYIDTRSDPYVNYIGLMSVIKHLDAAYDAKIVNYDSPNVKQLRLDNQKDVIEKQKEMANRGLNDYVRKDTKLRPGISVSDALRQLKTAVGEYETALDKCTSERDSSIAAAKKKHDTVVADAKTKHDDDIRSVPSKLNNEIAEENKKIEANFPKLAEYLLNRFINDELYRQASDGASSIDFPRSSYDAASADYCVIQGNEKRIQGFKVQFPLNLDDFVDLKNNSGERYKLTHPTGYYSILSTVPGAVFVAASAKEIYAWDLSSINILQKPIPPATISEGIFYLIRSDTNQYVVTKAGSIIRLGISDDKITQIPQSGKVNGNDTVFISTVSRKDEVYILGSNGSINGKTSGSIRIGVPQGGAITIASANGQFKIQ
jgi:vacuolar-type H+-ATPase subunit H